MNVSWLILIICFSAADSFKVLLCIGGYVKSLSNLFESIALAIADRGHEVVLITSYPPSKATPNITVEEAESLGLIWKTFNTFEIMETDKMTKFFNEFIDDLVTQAWQHPTYQKVFEMRKSFDVVIVPSYYSEFAFPFLMDSNAQLVQVVTPGIEAVSLSRSGNWLPPSVVPSILLNYDDKMAFWERVINLPAFIHFFYLQSSFMEREEVAIRRFFPEFTNLHQYYDRVDLTLINGHYAVDGPVPLLPNQVQIGTIAIKTPVPLPKHLEEFAEGSGEAGVIYFSLGSFTKTKDIPPHAMEAFLEAFGRIPQRVIWKQDSEVADLPPNVITQAWMPQQDILNHPKTKVFISHCGNQGTQEAKYFGVPVLGIPIAFDQPRNAAIMARKNMSIVLQWNQITTENIVNALNKLINDTTYKEHITAVSRMLQDQKESPAERAVWWIEYITRHKGTSQLVYAGKNMSLFQYMMLDIVAFWLILLCSSLFVIYKISLYIFRLIFTSFGNKQKVL